MGSSNSRKVDRPNIFCSDDIFLGKRIFTIKVKKSFGKFICFRGNIRSNWMVKSGLVDKN